MDEIIYNHYTITSDRSRIDVRYVHRYLSRQSYWARGIPLETVTTSIENSICVGVYKGERQVGFGRLITDYATYGYLADVFIDEGHRGKGLGKKLVGFILEMEITSRLRRIMLGTKDAHELYIKYGFSPLKTPQSFLEIHRPEIYNNSTAQNG